MTIVPFNDLLNISLYIRFILIYKHLLRIQAGNKPPPQFLCSFPIGLKPFNTGNGFRRVGDNKNSGAGREYVSQLEMRAETVKFLTHNIVQKLKLKNVTDLINLSVRERLSYY